MPGAITAGSAAAALWVEPALPSQPDAQGRGRRRREGVMLDARMMGTEPPWDGKRMIYARFEVVLEG